MRGPVCKVCECCNETFVCGQYGCWCAAIGVSAQQMTWIEQAFQDCLCPRCLQQVVDGARGPSSDAKPR